MADMEYRRLGRSGLKVSVLSFGSWVTFGTQVDTGFIVYNEVTYPNLTALFKHLDVRTKVSDMSFAVSLDGGRLEYSGTGLGGLLAQPANVGRPRFWSMLKELLRFYREAPYDIARIADDAQTRWPLLGVTIIHRIGRLMPGEKIVLVAVAAQHRSAAFQACEFLMDYLKTRAPFWKQEERNGKAQWVEARHSDDKAAERWRDK